VEPDAGQDAPAQAETVSCIPDEAARSVPRCIPWRRDAAPEAAALAELRAQAEQARDASDWLACGRGFVEVGAGERNAELAAEAARSALGCYAEALSAAEEVPARGASDRSLEERPLGDLEQGFLQAADLFLCRAAESPETASVRYRRARLFYEANRFGEAALGFSQLAFDGPVHEVAEYAVSLYLDSLNVLATRDPGRGPACRQQLGEDVAALTALYCGDAAARAAREDLCNMLDGVRCAVARRRAEDLRAAGAGAEADAALGEAGCTAP
jgi:tetratricopeptide (TPR) repeat protein